MSKKWDYFKVIKQKYCHLFFILKRIILVYFRSTTDCTSRSDVIKIARAWSSFEQSCKFETEGMKETRIPPCYFAYQGQLFTSLLRFFYIRKKIFQRPCPLRKWARKFVHLAEKSFALDNQIGLFHPFKFLKVLTRHRCIHVLKSSYYYSEPPIHMQSLWPFLHRPWINLSSNVRVSLRFQVAG